MKLEHITKLQDYSCGALGPLAVAVWERSGTTEQAQVAATLISTLSRSHPKLYIISVLGPEAHPPDAAMRDILANEVRRRTTQIVAVANLVEGQGFRGAAMRSVITGMSLLIRLKHAEKVCSTVREAADFISAQSEGALSASLIVQAISDLRSR